MMQNKKHITRWVSKRVCKCGFTKVAEELTTHMGGYCDSRDPITCSFTVLRTTAVCWHRVTRGMM